METFEPCFPRLLLVVTLILLERVSLDYGEGLT